MRVALISVLILALTSCATDEPGLPLTSGAVAQPEEPDKPLVCKFGEASNDKLADNEKRCTTLKGREEARNPDVKPESHPPE